MKCKYCGYEITELHLPWSTLNSKGVKVYHHFYFCDKCWSGYEYFAAADEIIIKDAWSEPGSQNYLKDWFADIAKQAGMVQVEAEPEPGTLEHLKWLDSQMAGAIENIGTEED